MSDSEVILDRNSHSKEPTIGEVGNLALFFGRKRPDWDSDLYEVAERGECRIGAEPIGQGSL